LSQPLSSASAEGAALPASEHSRYLYQHLAFTRALLHNPDVLLLDEATSSLDSESEKLQEAIDRAAVDGERTVAVAHRLATIQKADTIFVLGSGKVLECGTHQELLRAKGVCYSICQAPALDR
jgi:ATP-binding cassette, subfamily B (MDR/TAP), member 1